ncbi:F-box protein SKIP23 [Rhynchospora pubera]|uniref:F-box protein SKIP23 n=1 Tax=Rhynchospora pubera TaxID=906938 RepID=A0AAV8BUH1_9POAL|nr:F-box protein SKIP23 [Rhynchospora pubera]
MVTDWAHLPHDLLYVISTKLSDISDFIRFRAVCNSWRSSAAPSDHAPRLPWILDNDGGFLVRADVRLCPSFSNKIYTIRVPHAYNMFLSGPSDCYLLNSKKPISLLNPFTGNEIPLPPLRRQTKKLYPINFVGNRLRSEDPLVVLTFDVKSCDHIFGVLRPGDNEWLEISLRVRFAMTTLRGSFMYYKGHLYAHALFDRHTLVIEPTSGKTVFTIRTTDRLNNNHDFKEYMMESDEKLLRVIKRIENYQIESFEIYQLDGPEKGYRWTRIWDINDQMLFLESYSGFSMKSTNFHGLRGNCIYFFHYQKTSNPLHPRARLCRYDLGNNEIRILPYPFNRAGAWIIPCIH